MFGLRIATQQDGPMSYPWFTLGWMGVMLFFFGWSQWGLSQQTQQVRQSREKFLCFYLKHDYTVIPASLKRHLPKVLRQHTARVEPYIEHYHRGGMAHDQARQWLIEGNWGRSVSNQTFRSDRSCLQQAKSSGLLREHPKKRIFVTMAKLIPEDIVNNQKEMERLGQAYVQSRSRHPWYGWGLVPADRNWIALFSSFLITPTWFTLLWQLVFLGLVGSFMERQWGGPIWIALFIVTGFLGNLLLLITRMGSTTPLLGAYMALAGVMGMWSFATWGRPCTFWFRTASSSSSPRHIHFPAWTLTLVWFLLLTLDFLWLRDSWWLHLMLAIFCLGLGCAAQWGMQSLDWLEPLPVVQPNKSGTPIQVPEREKPQPRALKPSQAGTGPKPKSLYLKPDLKQMVKATYQQGEFEKAVEMYRELYKGGQARLEDFDELLLACEKGQIAPQADDFLRAIRAAAFAKRPDKATAYYHRCDNKRDQMPWSEREQISLAQELKRAGLYEDARRELEWILDQGPDGLFFMDALLLKIEILLEEAADLEEAAQLIYKAELYLEKRPQYQEAITRLRIRVSEIDGSSIPEIRKIPTGLGASSFHPHAAEESLDQKVDVSLLADLDAFEKRLAEAEEQPAPGQSWSELPMLILRQQASPTPLTQEEEHSNAALPVTPIDDDFLLGNDPQPPSPKPQDAFSTHPDVTGEEPQVAQQEWTNEQPHTNQAFSTLADDELLKNILEHQARLVFQSEQAHTPPPTSTQAENTSALDPLLPDSLWNEPHPTMPTAHATPLPYTWYPSTAQERHDLLSSGKETSMVPSLSRMLGDGPVDPALLLGTEFGSNAPPSSALSPLPAYDMPTHLPTHLPTSVPTAASDLWKTDWLPTESPSPLQDPNFALPLFGEDENLQATRELSTLLSAQEYALPLPTSRQERSHPFLEDTSDSQETVGRTDSPIRDISLFDHAPFGEGANSTETEIPQIGKPESLQGARPVSVIPPKGSPK